MTKARKISRTSAMHYGKLVFRSLMFLVVAVNYIILRINNSSDTLGELDNPILIGFVWIIFVVEMALRFFPSGIESKGCQKQFAWTYMPTGEEKPSILSNKVTILIAAGWLGANAVFGIIHLLGYIDNTIMLLLALCYSVCDMICILFFCPFQTWFMKNKCCTSCRIYNWDYAMMFTPLLFVNTWYAISLAAIAFILCFRWELAVYFHPERFSEKTNEYLHCKNCTEQLCRHKKQLQRFLVGNAEKFSKLIEESEVLREHLMSEGSAVKNLIVSKEKEIISKMDRKKTK